MTTDRTQEISAYIARHEQDIAFQRSRITPTAATSTRFLASQRIRACEEAISRLRAEQARGARP